MSYFRAAPNDPVTTMEAAIDPHEEIADGVTIDRRRVFWLSAAGVSALLLGRNPRAQDPAPRISQQPPQRLDYPTFLAEFYPKARRLVDSKGADEEAYLMTLAAAMTRIADPKAPLRAAMRAFREEHQKSGERFPLAAVSMKLKPGKGFSHHDHLDYNGVILGIDGEVRVRNYDFVGQPPALDSGKTFEIRETRDDLILPGRVSTLGRNRENVHDLVAGKNGAHVLDVFTFFSKRATSRYLEVDDQPRDAEARIHEAAWRQPRRR